MASRRSRLALSNHTKTPTTHAPISVAIVPPIIARSAIFDSSCRRDGASTLIPPIWMPMLAMLVELLLLGGDKPQVLALGLEEEEGYFAPALRFASEARDPFIPARSPSFTMIGTGDQEARLRQEATAARRQVDIVRILLQRITTQAEKVRE